MNYWEGLKELRKWSSDFVYGNSWDGFIKRCDNHYLISPVWLTQKGDYLSRIWDDRAKRYLERETK